MNELEYFNLKQENAQRGLTLASLCDMVLGENAEDRSDAALIRRVRELQDGFTAYNQEVEQFNAGYDAFRQGKTLSESEYEFRNMLDGIPDHDSFTSGYAWAKFITDGGLE